MPDIPDRPDIPERPELPDSPASTTISQYVGVPGVICNVLSCKQIYELPL